MSLTAQITHIARLLLLAIPCSFPLAFSLVYFPGITSSSESYVDILLAGSITEAVFRHPTPLHYRNVLLINLVLTIIFGFLLLYIGLLGSASARRIWDREIRSNISSGERSQIFQLLGSLLVFTAFVNPIIFCAFYLWILNQELPWQLGNVLYIVFLIMLFGSIVGHVMLTKLE